MNLAEFKGKYPQYSEVPDGKLVKALHGKFYSHVPYDQFIKKIDFTGSSVDPGQAKSPTEDMNELQKGLNIGANVAMALPTAAIPGANTVTGAGVVGGVMGLLQPVSTGESRASNTAVGAGLGAVGQKGAQMLTAKTLPKPQLPLSVREQTLKEGVEAGYTVPPSAVSDSFLGRRLESVGGKAALGQESAIRNQEVTNRLARQAANLGPDEDITLTTLKAARDKLAAPYQEVSNLSPTAKTALTDWREANKEAQAWYKAYERLPLPSLQKKAERFKETAERMLDTMEREAVSAGRPELVESLKKARIEIAKNYDVEKALNLGSGEVDASVIGRILDSKGDKAVTGELKTIGKLYALIKVGSGVFSP